MYINMTPDKTNKTLHASQDDTNRQFKFKLVNDSQVLDTSDSIPPVIYDVEPNGIEQLLPVNSSTPTTSPIIADIKYPDEIRNDQEFTERITPTTKKGQAKIQKIKGNTLVFNQLVNVNVASNYINFDNGVISLTGTPTGRIDLMTNNIEHVSNHKYLLILNTLANPNNVQFTLGMSSGVPWVTNVGTIGDHSQLYTNSYRTKLSFYDVENKDLTGIKMTCAIFDLTQMFGSGNEPTSVSDFTNLFPLSYYNYNAGSLLSFNGTGIKTTGKNLFNLNRTVGTLPTGNVRNFEFDKFYVGMTSNNYYASFTITNYEVTNDSVKVQCSNAGYGIGFPFKVKPNTTYTISFNGSNGNTNPVGVGYYDNYGNYLSNDNVTNSPFTFTTPSGCYVADIVFRPSLNILTTYSNIQLEIGSQATTYEPYTENTIDLPISTYFPTGMKSAGSVYDELTDKLAIQRVGYVDLGTLTYIRELYSGSQYRFKTQDINDLVKLSSQRNINVVCSKFIASKDNSDGSMFIGGDGVFFYNNTYTDKDAFKTAMNGVYLYYELATPTEEDIESCSLVSEDIEKPLEYDNGFLVCDSKGLTSKAGFIPCKVKKIKGDETLYSQLINLHVERKP